MSQQANIPGDELSPLGERFAVQAPAAEADPQGGGARLRPVGRFHLADRARHHLPPRCPRLCRVARVLRMEVGEFSGQAEARRPPLTRHHERPVYAVSPNSLSYERISSSFEGSVLRSVIIHEPPGHRSETHRA